MSEKVICKPTECKVKGVEYKPDPAAPSVAEIVAALREAMGWNWLDEEYPPPIEVEARLERIITRLEAT